MGLRCCAVLCRAAGILHHSSCHGCSLWRLKSGAGRRGIANAPSNCSSSRCNLLDSNLPIARLPLPAVPYDLAMAGKPLRAALAMRALDAVVEPKLVELRAEVRCWGTRPGNESGVQWVRVQWLVRCAWVGGEGANIRRLCCAAGTVRCNSANAALHEREGRRPFEGSSPIFAFAVSVSIHVGSSVHPGSCRCRCGSCAPKASSRRKQSPLWRPPSH